ncbi:6820_t:CDS:2, partial [Ambispora leptoticha]
MNDQTPLLKNNNRHTYNNSHNIIDKNDDAEPTTYSSVKTLLCCSNFNYLLIFIPFGILSKLCGWSDTWVFCLNFMGIIPLANLLGFATEDISLRFGDTIGSLLNATFGNAVELIISVVALNNGLIRVVQASILGSVLSNLLLVQGVCFFLGGIRYSEQFFNVTAAQTSASLLALAMISLLIPAAFYTSVDSEKAIDGILNLSHGTAIVLLIIYIMYLVFQLKTHSHLYESETIDGDDSPQMTIYVSIGSLLIISIIVSITADYLVGSIEGLVESWNISRTFVGIVLIPIVGNAAEHVSSVTFALKNKMDLCIGVAIGSSMQIALGMTPLLVILGWFLGEPLTLFFESFETCVLVVAILIVNYLIADGKSNWLEGAMLLAAYVIIAMAFFFYPDDGQVSFIPKPV